MRMVMMTGGRRRDGSCRCGHQFCYLCGKKWLSCACPQDSSQLGIFLGEIPTSTRLTREAEIQLERRWRRFLKCDHPENKWTRDPDETDCMLCGASELDW